MRPTASTLVTGYAALLVALLLGVLIYPGALLLRDMVILEHPALTLSAVGFGDLPARNVPQDGFVALLGFVNAGWLVRLLLVGCAFLGVWGVRKLTDNPWAQAAGITIVLWNPFVVERLLQGQWSLVIVAWLIPALIATRGSIGVYWICSLTPTGAVLGLVIAVIASQKKWLTLVVGLLCWLPWLIPSIIANPTSAATTVFVGRAEEYVGALGAFVGLGGIWNADAVPWSRTVGFAVFGVVLFALLIYRAPIRWVVLAGCATVAFGLLLLDSAAQVFSFIPGAALFRDSQKLALLLIPALVVAATKITKKIFAIAVIGLALLQIPDAPMALAELKPITANESWQRYPGKTLNMDSQGLISYQGRVMVDPLTKATNVVESGQLIVDHQVIDPPSESYQEAVQLWQAGDTTALKELGIGQVIEDGKTTVLTADPVVQPAERTQFIVGLLLLLYWLSIPIVWSLVSKRLPVSAQE